MLFDPFSFHFFELNNNQNLKGYRAVLNGQYWQLISLNISFSGWFLLAFIPTFIIMCFIDVFVFNDTLTDETVPIFFGIFSRVYFLMLSFVLPYIYVARAEFYKDINKYLKKNQENLHQYSQDML